MTASSLNSVYIYKLTTTSATQVYFGSFSTNLWVNIAVSSVGTTVALANATRGTGTTYSLSYLKCNGTNYTTYGSSFNITVPSSALYNFITMNVQGTYSTFYYTTSTVGVYRTYTDNGTGFSLKTSNGGTALLINLWVISPDGTKFIKFTDASGFMKVTAYNIVGLSQYSTITTDYSSSNALY